jgi:hypothetical protein
MKGMTKHCRLAAAAAAGTSAAGVLLAIAGAACSSSTPAAAQPEAGNAGEGGGAAIDSGPSGDEGDGSSTVSLTWQVTLSPSPGIGIADAGQGAPSGDGGPTGIPGVAVCVKGHGEIPCVMTATDGTFVLPGLPQATDLVITFKKDGYVPALKAIETARADMQTSNPIPMFSSSDPMPNLGFSIDMQQKGEVYFFVIGPAPADSGAPFAADQGATVTLMPANGNGPFYGDNNLFDAGVTSIIGGAGAYFNVDPGDYTLTVDDPRHNCAPISFPFSGWGYPVPPLSVEFPVLAGYVTAQVGFLCTAKAAIVATEGGGD